MDRDDIIAAIAAVKIMQKAADDYLSGPSSGRDDEGLWEVAVLVSEALEKAERVLKNREARS